MKRIIDKSSYCQNQLYHSLRIFEKHIVPYSNSQENEQKVSK